MLPAITRPSLLAGVKPTPLGTIVLACANYTRQHANFYVPVQIVFGLVICCIIIMLLLCKNNNIKRVKINSYKIV
jgi:hypothetical protein